MFYFIIYDECADADAEFITQTLDYLSMDSLKQYLVNEKYFATFNLF